MSTPSTAELIKALRAATTAERTEILSAIGQQPAGPVHTAATIAANVATLREVLEVLDERQATALLSDSGLRVWGVVEGDLLEVLIPYVDAHWEALEPDLGRVGLLCGEWGRRLLGKVERRVRAARLRRGAGEIAQVQALIAAARVAMEGDSEAIDQEAASAYEALLAEYAAVLGAEGGGGFIFGGFTAGDIALLRMCKRFMEKHEPERMRGSWLEINERLAYLYGRAKATGMDPETAMNESRIRAERREQPHVLFPGLRKGEPAKWGGYLRDVGGRADDGSGIWGGVRGYEEMEAAMRAWMEERAKGKGIESGLRNVGHLLP